jgi:predicted GNAT family acetyltransferase
MIDKAGDEKVDEAVRESFPASDAPATLVTGVRVQNNGRKPSAGPMTSDVVSDDVAENRFEITIEGQTAFLEYERQPGRIRLIHTEVPPRLQGRGLGSRLAKHALDTARADRLTIVAECPVVQAYLRKNPIR